MQHRTSGQPHTLHEARVPDSSRSPRRGPESGNLQHGRGSILKLSGKRGRPKPVLQGQPCNSATAASRPDGRASRATFSQPLKRPSGPTRQILIHPDLPKVVCCART